MEIVVKLDMDELNEIVSRQVFGESRKIRLEITEVAEALPQINELDLIPAKYSDWFTVPKSYKRPECPIVLQEDQLVQVKKRSGHSYTGFGGEFFWAQSKNRRDIGDILEFRIVNPEDDWLHVPNTHYISACPIVLDSDTPLEITRRSGHIATGIVGEWNASWLQEDNSRDIVKFRIVK